MSRIRDAWDQHFNSLTEIDEAIFPTVVHKNHAIAVLGIRQRDFAINSSNECFARRAFGTCITFHWCAQCPGGGHPQWFARDFGWISKKLRQRRKIRRSI